MKIKLLDHYSDLINQGLLTTKTYEGLRLKNTFLQHKRFYSKDLHEDLEHDVLLKDRVESPKSYPFKIYHPRIFQTNDQETQTSSWEIVYQDQCPLTERKTGILGVHFGPTGITLPKNLKDALSQFHSILSLSETLIIQFHIESFNFHSSIFHDLDKLLRYFESHYPQLVLKTGLTKKILLKAWYYNLSQGHQDYDPHDNHLFYSKGALPLQWREVDNLEMKGVLPLSSQHGVKLWN